MEKENDIKTLKHIIFFPSVVFVTIIIMLIKKTTGPYTEREWNKKMYLITNSEDTLFILNIISVLFWSLITIICITAN